MVEPFLRLDRRRVKIGEDSTHAKDAGRQVSLFIY